jgi:hypothetical protein
MYVPVGEAATGCDMEVADDFVYSNNAFDTATFSSLSI